MSCFRRHSSEKVQTGTRGGAYPFFGHGKCAPRWDACADGRPRGAKDLPREEAGYWISVGLRMISFGGILLIPSLPRMSGP